MEQHPVPQHVSSYQFKLVGDMTLKQFFQLAGGVLISLLFYASGLHPLIKWPAVLFFAILGAALAFLPFQDRPLEKWIIAFFKAIYSPTLYYWEKTKTASVFFQAEGGAPSGGTDALSTYLSKTPDKRLSFFEKLDTAEQVFLSKTRDLFGAAALPKPSAPGSTPAVPMFYQGANTQAPTAQRPEVAPERQTKTELYQVVPSKIEKSTGVEMAAQFSQTAAPPSPPQGPNLVTGQIMDTQGKIIESAIMEIQDETGRPVRALKTNKLGHFTIVTPLANGRYEIIIEKEGLSFDPLTFEAKGKIIPPIAIRAKTQANNQGPIINNQPPQTMQIQ